MFKKKRKRPKPVPVASSRALMRRTSDPRRTRLFFLTVLLIVGVFTLLLVVYKSPLFRIRTVSMHQIGADAAVVASLEALQGKNLLFLNTAAVEKKLERQYPNTDHITITKHFPNRLEIDTSGRTPAAVVRFALIDPTATESATQSAKTSVVLPAFFIDTRATLYQPIANQQLTASASGTSMPQLYNGLPVITYQTHTLAKLGQRVTGNRISMVLAFIALSSTGTVPFTGYTITDYGIWTKLPTDPFLIYLADDKDPKTQLAALQTILNNTKIERKRLLTVDLRYDNPTVTLR